MVKISILIPIYNNQEDILKAIESILKQTFQDFEIIIIDDGSTDNVLDIIKQINDPRIITLRFDTNRGVYCALNEGLLIAKGIYIARLDSDDIYDPTFLKKSITILDRHEKYIATYCYYIRSQPSKENKKGSAGEVTLVYRKKVLEKIGFYDSVRFAADTEYFLRMKRIFGRNSVKLIRETLYFAKKRENSLTTNPKTKDRKIRFGYRNNAIKWHRNSKNLYMPFPIDINNRNIECDPIMLP